MFVSTFVLFRQTKNKKKTRKKRKHIDMIVAHRPARMKLKWTIQLNIKVIHLFNDVTVKLQPHQLLVAQWTSTQHCKKCWKSLWLPMVWYVAFIKHAKPSTCKYYKIYVIQTTILMPFSMLFFSVAVKLFWLFWLKAVKNHNTKNWSQLCATNIKSHWSVWTRTKNWANGAVCVKSTKKANHARCAAAPSL